MTTKKKRNDDAALAKWTEDPTTWTSPKGVLRGDAAAYGQSVLEAAGVDIAAVERTAGRPRVGPQESAPKGVRFPRVHVAISLTQNQLLDQLAHDRGRSRSDLVREALDTYLSRAV